MKHNLNTKAATAFCAMLAAAGIAAPSAASASTVAGRVQTIRAMQATHHSAFQSNSLILWTNEQYRLQGAVAHVDGCVHGDGTGHVDLAAAPMVKCPSPGAPGASTEGVLMQGVQPEAIG